MTDRIGPPPAAVSAAQAAVRATAFRLLLNADRPVSPARLATELDRDIDAVVADLDVLDRAGRIKRTSGGEVLASLGLTLTPTHHRIAIADTRRHTCCALDALGILAVLAADGWIDSTNPATGHHFHFEVRDGGPTGHPPSCVLFIADQTPVASVIDQWCPLVNFFPDEPSARIWAESSMTRGHVLGLTEASERAGHLWRPLIHEPHGTTGSRTAL